MGAPQLHAETLQKSLARRAEPERPARECWDETTPLQRRQRRNHYLAAAPETELQRMARNNSQVFKLSALQTMAARCEQVSQLSKFKAMASNNPNLHGLATQSEESRQALPGIAPRSNGHSGWDFRESESIRSCSLETASASPPVQFWTFNMNNAPGTAGIAAAAMRHFYQWRRNIRDENMDPETAADWDANFERIGNGDYHTIRLNQEHRVHFRVDWGNEVVTLLKVGGHDL